MVSETNAAVVVREISLDSVLEFEIEAYKVESQLAQEKHKAQMLALAILDSRTWRYTKVIRVILNYVLAPLLKRARGVRLLRSLNRLLP